jgi:hypothetical protein
LTCACFLNTVCVGFIKHSCGGSWANTSMERNGEWIKKSTRPPCVACQFHQCRQRSTAPWSTLPGFDQQARPLCFCFCTRAPRKKGADQRTDSGGTDTILCIRFRFLFVTTSNPCRPLPPLIGQEFEKLPLTGKKCLLWTV